MLSRVVLSSLILCGGLMAAGAANAQPYGRPSYGGGGGRWDCSPSRCIDRGSGALWESTCDRRGCFPLRPARQRGYGGYEHEYHGRGPVYHGVPNGRGGYLMVPDERD